MNSKSPDGRLLINLGGGRQSVEWPHHISIDKIKSDKVSIVWDLENGLPKIRIDVDSMDLSYESKIFKDNTVDEFLCKHVLEHIRNLLQLMDEMWDALMP